MNTTGRTPSTALDRLMAARGESAAREGRITHLEQIPARSGMTTTWPAWTAPLLVDRLARQGISQPWVHQATAADHAYAGRSVIVSTGTASGKSLAYLLPALTAIIEGTNPDTPEATVLYLSPTKALAYDQARRIEALELGIRVACFDGDTPSEERDWVRAHASYVLTNPDMLHRTVLPGHVRWGSFLRRLAYVVIDECHMYKGVFGSHVAGVLRRLRRLAARYGASPVFILTSATVADPATSASALTGLDVTAVTEDASPRGEQLFALWEPPLTDHIGERGAPVRRSAYAEAADILTDLVLDQVRTVAFTRSRRGAELISVQSRMALEEHAGLGKRVAAYRAGYLRDDRRALEAALHSGDLLGMAATTALELGVDVSGLDAVVLTGFPGTRASLWQQAGRAGRDRQGSLAILIARDDPLDTYLIHHPDAIFRRPVEATVLDPSNPYVLAPHLCSAAAELPLTDADEKLFGPLTGELLVKLEDQGLLRRRPTGWFWTRRERPTDAVDIRGIGGAAVRIVEENTGTLLGTVDAGAAHSTVHDGAVHLHQGLTYLVASLDLDDATAVVFRADPDYTTFARETTDIAILETEREEKWGGARLCFGTVEVTSQVVGYLRKRILTGEILGETALDLPPRTLRTRSVWWTVDVPTLDRHQLGRPDLAGSAHAAEHASIGLLPLFAGCDRWDIGGVSTPVHADTGELTVFVYDGQPGGAGFAERGFTVAKAWLAATRTLIEACECAAGCPSCIQSPKCGNGNLPLDKSGAVRLLDALMSAHPPD